MESVTRRIGVGVALLATLAPACAGGGATHPAATDITVALTPTTTIAAATPTTDHRAAPLALPDVTTRPLTETDLLAMLPDGESRAITNADAVMSAAADPDDAAADVLGFRREVGVATAVATASGPGYVRIDLLADADHAHRYLLDTAGDIVKRVDGTHDAAAVALSATEFPIAVGEESIGLLVARQGDPAAETAVVFRLGRLVIFASLEHEQGEDLRVPLQHLAEDVQSRALARLAATPVTDHGTDRPSYRFETTMTVTAGDVIMLVERNGTVDAAGMTCAVRVVDGAGEHTRTVRSDPGGISSSTDGLVFRPVGAGDLAARAVLAGCSSWPLDGAASGLDDLATGTATRHRVNGVTALGYTPEPAALGPVLGSSLQGAVVDSFSFWLAEGTPWVVEVGFIVSADATVLAAALPQGWDALGPIRLAVRHRVFDLEG